jgi:hypothetical protein
VKALSSEAECIDYANTTMIDQGWAHGLSFDVNYVEEEGRGCERIAHGIIEAQIPPLKLIDTYDHGPGNDIYHGKWSFKPDQQGTYTLELYVTDGCESVTRQMEVRTACSDPVTEIKPVYGKCTVTVEQKSMDDALVQDTSVHPPTGIWAGQSNSELDVAADSEANCMEAAEAEQAARRAAEGDVGNVWDLANATAVWVNEWDLIVNPVDGLEEASGYTRWNGAVFPPVRVSNTGSRARRNNDVQFEFTVVAGPDATGATSSTSSATMTDADGEQVHTRLKDTQSPTPYTDHSWEFGWPSGAGDKYSGAELTTPDSADGGSYSGSPAGIGNNLVVAELTPNQKGRYTVELMGNDRCRESTSTLDVLAYCEPPMPDSKLMNYELYTGTQVNSGTTGQLMIANKIMRWRGCRSSACDNAYGDERFDSIGLSALDSTVWHNTMYYEWDVSGYRVGDVAQADLLGDDLAKATARAQIGVQDSVSWGYTNVFTSFTPTIVGTHDLRVKVSDSISTAENPLRGAPFCTSEHSSEVEATCGTPTASVRITTSAYAFTKRVVWDGEAFPTVFVRGIDTMSSNQMPSYADKGYSDFVSFLWTWEDVPTGFLSKMGLEPRSNQVCPQHYTCAADGDRDEDAVHQGDRLFGYTSKITEPQSASAIADNDEVTAVTNQCDCAELCGCMSFRPDVAGTYRAKVKVDNHCPVADSAAHGCQDGAENAANCLGYLEGFTAVCTPITAKINPEGYTYTTWNGFNFEELQASGKQTEEDFQAHNKIVYSFNVHSEPTDCVVSDDYPLSNTLASSNTYTGSSDVYAGPNKATKADDVGDNGKSACYHLKSQFLKTGTVADGTFGTTLYPVTDTITGRQPGVRFTPALPGTYTLRLYVHDGCEDDDELIQFEARCEPPTIGLTTVPAADSANPQETTIQWNGMFHLQCEDDVHDCGNCASPPCMGTGFTDDVTFDGSTTTDDFPHYNLRWFMDSQPESVEMYHLPPLSTPLPFTAAGTVVTSAEGAYASDASDKSDWKVWFTPDKRGDYVVRMVASDSMCETEQVHTLHAECAAPEVTVSGNQEILYEDNVNPTDELGSVPFATSIFHADISHHLPTEHHWRILSFEPAGQTDTFVNTGAAPNACHCDEVDDACTACDSHGWDIFWRPKGEVCQDGIETREEWLERNVHEASSCKHVSEGTDYTQLMHQYTQDSASVIKHIMVANGQMDSDEAIDESKVCQYIGLLYGATHYQPEGIFARMMWVSVDHTVNKCHDTWDVVAEVAEFGHVTDGSGFRGQGGWAGPNPQDVTRRDGKWSFTPTLEGTYTLQVVVRDGCQTVRRSITVTTVCHPPITFQHEAMTSVWNGLEFDDMPFDASNGWSHTTQTNNNGKVFTWDVPAIVKCAIFNEDGSCQHVCGTAKCDEANLQYNAGAGPRTETVPAHCEATSTNYEDYCPEVLMPRCKYGFFYTKKPVLVQEAREASCEFLDPEDMTLLTTNDEAALMSEEACQVWVDTVLNTTGTAITFISQLDEVWGTSHLDPATGLAQVVRSAYWLVDPENPKFNPEAAARALLGEEECHDFAQQKLAAALVGQQAEAAINASYLMDTPLWEDVDPTFDYEKVRVCEVVVSGTDHYEWDEMDMTSAQCDAKAQELIRNGTTNEVPSLGHLCLFKKYFGIP